MKALPILRLCNFWQDVAQSQQRYCGCAYNLCTLQLGVAMKIFRLSLAASIAIAISQPSRAEHLEPGFSWTGVYIGATYGHAWGDGDVKSKVVSSFANPNSQENPAFLEAMKAGVPHSLSTDDTWMMGGGYIGYNVQINNNWILGAEFDVRGTDLEDSALSNVIAPGSIVVSGLRSDLELCCEQVGRLGCVSAGQAGVSARATPPDLCNIRLCIRRC